MDKSKSDLLAEVAAYYSAKLAEHGATPLGVDWNGEKSSNATFRTISQGRPETTRLLAE